MTDQELAAPTPEPRRGSIWRAASNAAWLVGARITGDAVNVILMVVLARRFGPAGYGQYAYGFAVATFVYYFLNPSLDQFAVRECTRLPPEGRRRLIGSLLGLQLGVAVIVAAGLLGFLWLTRATFEITAITLILSLYQGSAAVSWTLFMPALADQRMALAALAEPLCRILSILGAIVVVAGFAAPLPLALAFFPAGGLVMLGLGIWSARTHVGRFPIRITWSETRRSIGILWPFAGAEIAYQVWARADLILVTQFLGLQATGIYASAVKFFETATVPIPLAGLAAYPLLSRSAPTGERGLPKGSDRVFAGMLALGFVISWALWFVAPLVLVPLLGTRFTPAAELLKYLAPAALMVAVEHTSGRILVAANAQKTRFHVLAISAGCKFVLAAALIPILGLPGAVLAWIVAWILNAFLSVGALLRGFSAAPVTRSAVLVLPAVAGATLAGVTILVAKASPALAAAASLAVFAIWLTRGEFIPLVAGRPLGALIASLRKSIRTDERRFTKPE